MSKKRSYTLVGEDADRAMEQIVDLAWPDGEPVRMGDFGRRLKISGLLFQGEGHEVLLLGPNAAESTFIREVVSGKYHAGNVEGDVVYIDGSLQPDLETWCKIIKQTDDPVYFEQNEEGMIKAVHRKVRAQISGGVQWEIFERDGFRCLYCGRKGGSGCPLTIDHLHPLELGGQNIRNNYICSCRACNKKKGSQDPVKWCRENGLDYEGLKLHAEGKAPVSFIAHLA